MGSVSINNHFDVGCWTCPVTIQLNIILRYRIFLSFFSFMSHEIKKTNNLEELFTSSKPLRRHIEEVLPLTDDAFEFILSHFDKTPKRKREAAYRTICHGRLVDC